MRRAPTSTFTRARAAVTASFASHAVIAGTLGPWIPQLKQRTDLDDGGLGLALTGYAVGLVAGTRIAGPALRVAGARSVVRVGVPALAVGLALLPLASGLASLAAILVVIGLASGVLDVAMNTEAVVVEDRYERRVMSSLHGSWSVAMLAGAVIASASIASGVPIAAHLPAVALLLVVASFPLLRRLPAPGDAGGAAVQGSAGNGRSPVVRVLLLCVVGFASFLTEGIAAEWSAVYLHEVAGASIRAAALGVVAFSTGMTASRFTGDRLCNRFGPSHVVRVGAATGGVALGVAIVTGNAGVSLVSLAVLGVALGPVIPAVFGVAGRLHVAPGRTALTMVLSASYLGSVVGPLAVGLTSNHAGLRAAFLIPVGMCVAAAVAAGAIRPDRFPSEAKTRSQASQS
jgi:fucose permease